MIKLVRLDYRLLHGQVVVSWAQSLGIQRIIVVDNAAATDELKKTALNLSKPTGIRLNIFTVETALGKMPKVDELKENIMFVFGDTAQLLTFCEAYSKIKEINYGGMSNKEGAKQFGGAIFLTDSQIDDTRKLKDMGIQMYIQQTPMDKKESLNPMI